MNDTPKVLGIIPARSGSKGIPNKNLKLLDGRPLIWYTIVSSLSSGLLDRVMVSSDDPDILNFAGLFPEIEVPFVRPEHLATDGASTISVVQHALHHYQQQGVFFDYICLLQPTSPFRSQNLIDQCIQHTIETNADSLITVRRIPDQYNPYWAFKSEEQTQLSWAVPQKDTISQRQGLPVTYHRDGCIYVTKTTLVRQGLLLGGKIAGFENLSSPYINIDTQADWDAAEKLLANGK